MISKVASNATLKAALFSGLLCVLYYGLYLACPAYLFEPDRYFHLAIAKYIVATNDWRLQSIPYFSEVYPLGGFPNTTPFFHWLSTLLLALNGEATTTFFFTLFGFATLLLLYIEANRRLQFSLIAFLLVFSCEFFPRVLFRHYLYRPFVASVFFFLLYVVFLERKKIWGVFFAALGFGYFYHFPFLLLFPLTLHFLFERGERKLYLAALGGLFLPLFLHPSFPSNFSHYVHLLQYALTGANQFSKSVGEELRSLTAREFLFYHFSALLLLLPILRWNGSRFWGGMVLGLLGLSIFSSRIDDYLFPMIVLATANLSLSLERKRKIALLLVLLSVGNGYFLASKLKEWRHPVASNPTEGFAHALAPIPLNAGKVFNCEWTFGSIVPYVRPDLRPIDFLDPANLMIAKPELARDREALLAGEFPSISYTLRKNNFSYAICERPEAIKQMRDDPGLKEITYNREANSGVHGLPLAVFQINEKYFSHFVTKLKIKVVPTSEAEFINVKPSNPLTDQIDAQAGYFDFLSLATKSDPATCVNFQIAAENIREDTAAILVGGGRNIRIWQGDKLLFSSVRGYTIFKTNQALIPWHASGAGARDLKGVVCSLSQAPLFGLSIATLSKADLLGLCSGGKLKADDGIAEFVPGDLRICPAPVAVQKTNFSL